MNYSTLLVIFGYFGVVRSFTKYGRNCQDIGCPSTQECVMKTDPCSFYSRQGECGSYPTCERKANAIRTCKTHVCPPTQVCQMDGDTPKCVENANKAGHVGYATSGNTNYLSQNSNSNGGNLYPHIPKSETTPRPNINRPVNSGGYQGGRIGSGYPGGQVGSGYPGGQVGSGYPGGQVGSGYPGGQMGSGYPGGQVGSGYPQQVNYPRQAYPQQSGYPQQRNYPGYTQGAPTQNGYQQYGGYPQQNYAQNQKSYSQSSGSSVSDKITNGLKSIGGFFKKLGIN
ncbi:TATA-binding protein-associated factor 2N isoform X2 [Diorhabda sublineata]|uniref:TATA-binding protein-associated factor 2N isoform X2 n=1 Tax=Diorhabda sublineata TaxID=1163346 RepID=UPI0024E180F1|nr:TATA-binding protein-associated factor 2N isoform X2 [Diorhabda sublineata]